MRDMLRGIVQKYLPHLYIMNYKKNMKPRLKKNQCLRRLAPEHPRLKQYWKKTVLHLVRMEVKQISHFSGMHPLWRCIDSLMESRMMKQAL